MRSECSIRAFAAFFLLQGVRRYVQCLRIGQFLALYYSFDWHTNSLPLPLVKKVAAIVICLCLLMQCMAHYVVTGFYELNKDYIAKNLCENKDKPQMKCCGKCYLRKQLKKVDDNESPSKNAPSKVEKNEVAAFVLPALIPFSLGHSEFETRVERTPVFQHLRHSVVPFPIFHPPSVAC